MAGICLAITALFTEDTLQGRLSIGIDFGTTNTVIAVAKPGETVRPVTFRDDRELSDLYRSVLCFEHLSESRHDVQAQAGGNAILAYLTSIYETRFIQSDDAVAPIEGDWLAVDVTGGRTQAVMLSPDAKIFGVTPCCPTTRLP